MSLKRVVIVSSSGLFRDGLKRVLVKVALVQLADSMAEVEELVHKGKVDAVIIDQAEGQMTGSGTISRLLSIPGARVIIVSLQGDAIQIYRHEQVDKASAEDLIEAVLD